MKFQCDQFGRVVEVQETGKPGEFKVLFQPQQPAEFIHIDFVLRKVEPDVISVLADLAGFEVTP